MNSQSHPEEGRWGPSPRSQALYLDLGPRVQKKVEKSSVSKIILFHRRRNCMFHSEITKTFLRSKVAIRYVK